MAPSVGPTHSPSVPIFDVVQTKFGTKSPFSGISPSDLADRFAAIVALLEAVMRKLLGPDRANWGTRVVSVGGRATRRTLSSLETFELFALAEENVVEVEYEFTLTTECRDEGGCNEGTQTAALNEGLETLDVVTTAITSGALQQTVIAEAETSGLSQELSNISVSTVTVENPIIEIIEATPYPSIEVFAAPTHSPTSSPTYDCEDSPLRFQVKNTDDEVINRYCSWVKVRPYGRCKLKGVREHCPQSCGKCQHCVDSSLKFKFAYDGIEEYRKCKWVARQDTDLICSTVEGISNTCPLTCGTCKTATPTGAPTPAPSDILPCHDSALRFKVNNGDEIINRYCAWVKASPNRCSLTGVPSMCPLTCGTCENCVDSSLTFKLNQDDGSDLSCDWVGKDAQNRCSIEGVSRSCRNTCGTGSCCVDSSEKFTFKFRGETMRKFCTWAARKNTSYRCRPTKVKKMCRQTCGTCGI